MENIVIFGGGHHAGVCIDIIEQENNYNIIGIIDSVMQINTYIHGYKIIGRQEELLDLQSQYNFNKGFISIGENFVRKRIVEDINNLNKNFSYINIISSKAIISPNIKMGFGNLVMPGVIINRGAEIQNFCILNTGCQLEHNSKMNNYSHLSAGSITGGCVEIGELSTVTLNVTIIDRIKIGKNCVIGSSSLVLNDLPDNVLAYGIPAKIVRNRAINEKIY